ncbi:unnamed protein product [Meloidogyne enterolobii]
MDLKRFREERWRSHPGGGILYAGDIDDSTKRQRNWRSNRG